jgi:hypothetical protein
MRFKILFVLTLFFCEILFSSSPLYIPREIKTAIANGTRTTEGIPGPNYWQNSADYFIDASVDVDSSRVSGSCRIIYYNNSPDTLRAIRFRLYQDILKKGAVRDWYLGAIELHDGVKVSNLVIDEKEYSMQRGKGEVQFSSTNMVVVLKEPLLPSSNAEIKMDWSFLVPKIARIRMGNYGDGEMFIAYWYPQVAVYDDIDGWDRVEYAGSVEFYNDFNNYEFNITLPDDQIVWATGELQNANEVLNEQVIERLNEAKQSDETIRIVTQEDYESFDVTKKNGMNTWSFKAEQVPDVSFGISDNYNWDAASTEVEPGRRVVTHAVYPDGKVHWPMAAHYSRATVKYMSEELPGYPYPYPHVTSYCNKGRGGGMETPMMANNGAPEVLGRHIGLIFHEIAHNYFPFMMGTNERKYAWMDEGWASFFPTEIVDRFDEEYDSYSKRVAAFENHSGKESELPLMVLSYSNKSKGRTAAYDRPAVAYNELYTLLGRNLFKEALKNYIETWKGKHPIPLDFFASVNNTVGEDLNWFWKPWFYEFGAPDLAVNSVAINGEEALIKVEKVGNLPTTVHITIHYDDGSSEEIKELSSVWKDGNSLITIKHKSNKNINKVVVGNSHIPDIDKSNNTYELKTSQS